MIVYIRVSHWHLGLPPVVSFSADMGFMPNTKNTNIQWPMGIFSVINKNYSIYVTKELCSYK